MPGNTQMLINQKTKFYFLTQILGAKVSVYGEIVGKLVDIIVIENGKLPEVTHLYVQRPYGKTSLLIPLEKVVSMSHKEIVANLDELRPYEAEPKPDDILLRDHILDKKVLDMEDREVEVVYDVKMALQNGKLYVTDVDLSHYGLLRRLHLKWLADLIYKPDEQPNPQLLSWTYVQHLPVKMGSFQGEVKLNILKDKLEDIAPVDLADILEEMDSKQRVAVFSELETEHASDILEEIDPSVQRDIVASLNKDKVAALINEMTPAQAADVLSALPSNEADNILVLLEPRHAKKIQSILSKQETKIIDFTTHDFIKFQPQMTVAEAEAAYPKVAKGKKITIYIYVVDENEKLVGVIDLKDLLLAEDNLQLKDIMADKVIALHTGSSLKEAYKTFIRYSFKVLPVVDENGKILGVLPDKDIVRLKHKFLV